MVKIWHSPARRLSPMHPYPAAVTLTTVHCTAASTDTAELPTRHSYGAISLPQRCHRNWSSRLTRIAAIVIHAFGCGTWARIVSSRSELYGSNRRSLGPAQVRLGSPQLRPEQCYSARCVNVRRPWASFRSQPQGALVHFGRRCSYTSGS